MDVSTTHRLLVAPFGRVRAAIDVAMPKGRFEARQVPRWTPLPEAAARRSSAAMAVSIGP